MGRFSLLRRFGIIRSTERRTRIATALVGAALTIFIGWCALFRLGGSLLSLSYDVPFVAHRAGSPDEIRIVYLDELEGESLDRRVQAPLLDRLNADGARGVVYDLIFDLPSKDPQIDAAFAAAIRRFRGVDEAGNALPGKPRRPVLLACGRTLIGQTGALGERLVPPTDVLLDAADDFGLVAFVHDEGFTVRELATGSRDEPSLAWKAAVALGAKLDEGRRLETHWINYAGPPPDPDDRDAVPAIRSCTARNVLDGAEPGFFRDKVIVVGGKPGIVGAAAGKDLFSTPFHRFQHRSNVPLMSGVELQANVLANLLRGNWLRRTGPVFDMCFIVAAGALAGAGLALMRPLKGIWLGAAAIVLLVLGGILSVHYARIWFPWSIAAFLQIPVALVWGGSSHFYTERFQRLKLTEEQRRLRDAFSKYLSPQMLDRLSEKGFQVNVGGEKIEAAMMFTDIESFTDVCQRVRDPERIIEMLNDYFQRTTGHIFNHDGVVVQFIGDAIFAAWGTPLPDSDASVKAVRAAWKLFESDKLVIDGDALQTRMGLHFGEVVAGNVGSDRHVDYSLIGDAVNLTSRLEGLNKLLGTNVLLSGALRERIGTSFRTRCVGCFQVKGRSEATTVYELLGPMRQEAEPEWIAEYHRALDALEKGNREIARSLFASVDSQRIRGDGPARYFIDFLDRGGLAPGGIIELKEK